MGAAAVVGAAVLLGLPGACQAQRLHGASAPSRASPPAAPAGRPSPGTSGAAALRALAAPGLTGGGCVLGDLFLHSNADANGNALPIDVFRWPNRTDMYGGVMDYGMDGFNIEASATPEDRCKVGRKATWTTMVDPGSFALVEVVIEPSDVHGFGTKNYLINVSRQTGSETALSGLWVAGAYLQPLWSPSVHHYTAYLGLKQDFASFAYERSDDGQTVELVSELEEPVPPREDAHGPSPHLAAIAAAAVESGDRGLPVQVGEVQHQRSTLATPLDLGHQRLVRLVVRSADTSASSEYSVLVLRPACPEEEPFYDLVTRRCTDVCNEGFFGSYATGRCTECLQRHCAVCDAAEGEGCGSCFEGYERRGRGCVAIGSADNHDPLSKVEHAVESYGQSHWALLLGVLGAIATLLATCWVIAYVCRQRARRKRRLLDEDEEEMSASAYYEDSYRG